MLGRAAEPRAQFHLSVEPGMSLTGRYSMRGRADAPAAQGRTVQASKAYRSKVCATSA